MNEKYQNLPDFSQAEVTDSVLPAEGSLFKLIKSMCPADHVSTTKTEEGKTQLKL